MKNSLEKIAFSMINKINQKNAKLEVSQFEYLFETHPALKRLFLEEILNMPVIIDNMPVNLSIPAINVLFIVANQNTLIKNYLWDFFKKDFQPFKEVYIYLEDKKLVHNLDLFSITGWKLALEGPYISFNIQNINQFYIYLRRNKGLDYDMQEWHYDRHIKFDIDFESLFLQNWNYNVNEMINKKIEFNSIANPYINLNVTMEISLSNINEANPQQREKIGELLKYKLTKQEINFEWNEDRVATLIDNSDVIFGNNIQSNKSLTTLIKNFINSNMITEEILSLLLIANKEVFKEIIEYIGENNIEIFNSIKILPESNQSIQKDQLAMQYIQEQIEKYIETDFEIINICKEIIKRTELLYSIKGLSYFSENLDEKLSIEKLFNEYIPTVLENYFTLPEVIRNDKTKNFFKMTIEQLSTMNTQLEKCELDILENEMRKMKVFGKFLDVKYPINNPLFRLGN